MMAGLEPPSTIPALLAQLAIDRAEHPAIITRAETLTYRELDERSARMARALLAAGAGKGTRIALLAPDGALWLTAFLASLRIGALLVAVSTLATPPEIAHILRHGDCQMLIGARRFLRRDFADTLVAGLPGLAEGKAGALRLVNAPYLRTVWLDDAQGLGWAAPISDLLARPDAPDASLLSAIEREVTPSDPAVIVYTSGSTASPKAVVHSQWTLARHPPELARQFALTPDDRMMCLLPLFWVAGMSMALQALCIGGTLVYPDDPGIEASLAMIADYGVTRVNAWGDKQPKLVEAAHGQGIDISHIPDLAGFRDAGGQGLPGTIHMYGMTESFSAHSAAPLGLPIGAGKDLSMGRAINGYERRVVDMKTGETLPSDAVGELQIRGPAMLAGLYKMQRADVFTPDGFYPTKDIVRIDKDGFLFPVGRTADMIKTRGANVSRLEVEAALAALPGVELPVVTGIADAEMGQMVAAAVVPKSGFVLTEAMLRDALSQTLSSFKIPRRIVFIDEDAIPRTSTGKIKLFELAAMIKAKVED